MKLVSSGKAFAMESALYPIVLAILFRYGAGNVSQILGRIPEIATVEEEVLERFVTGMAEVYDFASSEVVFVVQDEGFDISAFSKFCSGEVLNFGKSVRVHIARSRNDIPRILKSTFWTRSTLFILLLKRYQNNDKFFVDLKYQSTGVRSIKDHEIRKDFGDIVETNETRYARHMKGAFKHFWDARVTNVIALVPKKSNIYVYTYFPYTELNCPDSLVPVLMNIWFADPGRFYRTHNMFPDKMKNMHQCLLNVTLIYSPPGVMAEKGRVDGIEGELLKYIFHSLNAKPRFHFVNAQDVSMNDSETALNFVLENVSAGESEVGAGFLIPTVSYAGCTEQIYFGLGLCLTWAVPRVNAFGGALGPIKDTFTASLWRIFFFVAAISSLILWRFNRPKKLSSSIFCVIAITLGKSVPLPREKFTKTFLFTFMWYSTILGWAFQAGLGSNNISFRPPPQYESTREIIESRFEITGVESAVQLFKQDIKFFRNNGQAIEVEAMDIHNALLKVAYKKETAYVGLRLAIVYYIQFLNPELMEHVYVHNKCLVSFQPFFALRKNSPLSLRVRSLTFSLVEGGFKYKLEEKYMERIRRQWGRRRILSKGSALARGSLLIMWTGTVFSIFVFLGECVFPVLKRGLCPPKRIFLKF